MNILVVEDNKDHAETLKRVLEARESSYQVTCVNTLSAAIDILKKMEFEAALLDLSLPDAQGDIVVEKIKDASEGVPIVVLTGWADQGLHHKIKQAGADALLLKPAEPAEISLQLQYAILNKKHKEEKHKIEETLGHIGQLVDKIGDLPTTR